MNTLPAVLLRSSADHEDHAFGAAAIFVAELFAILHPATLPMLERMFEDVKRDYSRASLSMSDIEPGSARGDLSHL